MSVRIRVTSAIVGAVCAAAMLSSTGSAQGGATVTPNVWTLITPTYTGAPLGGTLVPQLWQTGNGVDAGDHVLFNDRWSDSVRGTSIYANGVFGLNPVTKVVEVLKLDNWRNVACTQARIDAGECRSLGGSTTDKLPEWQTDPTPVDSHPLAGMIYDPGSRALLDINGANSSAYKNYPDGDMFETWRMSLDTRRWTKVADGEAGDPHPPKDIADYSCAVFDPSAQKGVRFTVNNTGTVTWLFDFATNRWSALPMATSAVGVKVAVSGCTYDSVRRRILVLGGGRSLYEPASTDVTRQQLRAYSVATNTWTTLAAPPVVPMAPEFAYAEAHDGALALIRRKQTDGTTVLDTYFYDAVGNRWLAVGTGLNRGAMNIAAHSGTLTYHKKSGLFVTYGGTWQGAIFATLKYDASISVPVPQPAPAPAPAPPPATEPPPTQPPPSGSSGLSVIGPGCTTAWFTDVDCDGYATAIRSSGVYGTEGLGDKPDADDNDAAINTPATVLAAYDANKNGVLEASELKKFLAARRGLSAVGNVFYVTPNGNDSTGAANDPAKPYATYGGVHAALKAGDAVVYRGGVYTEPRIGGGFPSIRNGVAGQPTVLMSAPGELVSLRAANWAISTTYAKHIVIDGFTIDAVTPKQGNGIVMSLTQDALIRNIEVQKFAWPTAMQDIHRVTVERFVSHDQYEHGLYFGSRDLPNSDITIRESHLYRNGITMKFGGFQHNGRVTNLRFERNIVHSNGQWAITFAQGVSDSFVTNNLLFNNAGNGIIFQVYGHGPEYEQACLDGTQTLCPYQQVRNTIAYNTLWLGRYNMDGIVPTSGQPSLGIAVLLGRNGLSAAYPAGQGQNTFQNNIIVTDQGPTFSFLSAEWLDTTTIKNNLIYRTGGEGAGTVKYGATNYTFSQFQQEWPLVDGNVFGNPQFRAADVNWWGTPQRFDFRVLSGSPALSLSAGAYANGSQTMAPSTPTGLRIIR